MNNLTNRKGKKGILKVITGPMFAGKTEAILREEKRAKLANINVIILNPHIDSRQNEHTIKTHDGNTSGCFTIDTLSDIIDIVCEFNTELVIIDEIQFFERGILRTIDTLIEYGKDVIVVGLDMDYRGFPFYVTSQLLAKADIVEKLTSVCLKCGNDATMTMKLEGSAIGTIVIGGSDKYEARCKDCHEIPEKGVVY